MFLVSYAVLMALWVAMALGTFMLGLLDRRFEDTKAVVIVSSVLALFPLIILAIYPAESANS